MDKSKINEILHKYICEDIRYLYYEDELYPNWVNREQLIQRILIDVFKDPDQEDPISCMCSQKKYESIYK